MAIFYINEFDNDYRTWVGTQPMEFPSLEAAQAYCKEQSWSGLSYSVDLNLIRKSDPEI